VMVAKLLQ
jgi:hypothetical protein